MSTLVARALLFAARAHWGQRRKGNETPYVLHPIRVALSLARCGHCDPSVLAAALLHDVVEDTPYDVAAPVWPARVVEIVAGCTEAKHDDDWDKIPWMARKDGLLRAARQDRDVALVKAADLTDNLRSTAADGWGCISASKAEYGRYAAGLFGLVEGTSLGDELLRAARDAGILSDIANARNEVARG